MLAQLPFPALSIPTDSDKHSSRIHSAQQLNAINGRLICAAIIHRFFGGAIFWSITLWLNFLKRKGPLKQALNVLKPAQSNCRTKLEDRQIHGHYLAADQGAQI